MATDRFPAPKSLIAIANAFKFNFILLFFFAIMPVAPLPVPVYTPLRGAGAEFQWGIEYILRALQNFKLN